MALRIEDYALIGDTNTAALVGRNGSIDWLCLPRFDSPACFASLVGSPANGRWMLSPDQDVRRVTRSYRDGTLVLDTVFETAEGEVVLTDFMPRPRHGDLVELIRIVQCRRGRVPMCCELLVRFGYGKVAPWLVEGATSVSAVAGPDSVSVYSTVPISVSGGVIRADFVPMEGDEASFALSWRPSHIRPAVRMDTIRALVDTEAWWRTWSGRCRCGGPWHDAVTRSLITLKALTSSTTGGIVAAPTTSLPEKVGGRRNWDYRYCWLRDATFTLYALMQSGYVDEARAWREWLLRAVAGEPEQLQIYYGVDGGRWINEWEAGWLPGYEHSRPVRIGNAARTQLQLDVFGEVMDVFHSGHRLGLDPRPEIWRLQRAFMDCLESAWERPDEGIWEMRGPPRQFVHSKVMVWVAFDRAIRAARKLGWRGPVERWCALRKQIHDEVCDKGWNSDKGSFVQFYGADQVDASLLLMPLVGFLAPDDPRVSGTIRAVERDLMVEGLVHRYASAPDVDGLPPGEGAFLACSFWYADALLISGRRDEAQRVFERLLALRNDVGLLSEEYDVGTGRQLGNFPQAFSHVALVNTAHNLTTPAGPARQRSSD